MAKNEFQRAFVPEAAIHPNGAKTDRTDTSVSRVKLAAETT